NIHSQIRNNTTSLHSPEAIINQAYLDLHDQTFINQFKKYHHYPYTKKVKNNTYKLPTLNAHIDLRSLPTGYHTSFPPNPELCDHCKKPFEDDDGIILICGHGYHANCYNKLHNRCGYCEEFL
ncbi:5569_t:CDS:2, partial [Entrophospora sp. SA101]